MRFFTGRRHVEKKMKYRRLCCELRRSFGSAFFLLNILRQSQDLPKCRLRNVIHSFTSVLQQKNLQKKKRAISPLNIPTRVFQNPYSSIRLNLNSPGLCLFHFRQHQPQDAIFHGGAYFILIDAVRNTEVAMKPTGFILPNQGCLI